MKINTGIPAHDLNAVGAAAQAAEANGFSGISTQENRQDAFMPLAVAAAHTSTLELRTSIAAAFAQPDGGSEYVVGFAASFQQQFIGLGSQVKGHNIRRFGVPWSAPAPRMQEYVQAVHLVGLLEKRHPVGLSRRALSIQFDDA